jgi:hypothetical protein
MFYRYDISYRPGKDNIVLNVLTRAQCSAVNANTLNQLHRSVCYLGITRIMSAFVRGGNLPYSVEDMRKITNACSIFFNFFFNLI